MRGCTRIKGLLASYLDGEMGRRKRSKIEAHLEKCTRCMREYQLEKHINELLTSEMRQSARESDPLLTWGNLRPSLDREVLAAKMASRWTHTVGNRLTACKEMALPTAARTFSEVSYWGKKTAVPVLIVFLAFIFYHSFRAQPHTPGPASTTASGTTSIVVRINFGPEMAATSEGYFTDAGRPYSPDTSNQERNNAAVYGWKRG